MTEIKAWDSVRRFWRILLNKLFYAGNKLDRHGREGSMYIALKYQSKYLKRRFEEDDDQGAAGQSGRKAMVKE